MNATSTDEVMRLKKQAGQIKDFFDVKLPELRRRLEDDMDDLDKHRDGFFQDDKIQPCNMGRIAYASFSGYYGSNSTYSDFCPIDNDLVQKYFVRYLNSHTNEIFYWMADEMEKDALEKTEKAIQELSDIITELKSIQNSVL